MLIIGSITALFLCVARVVEFPHKSNDGLSNRSLHDSGDAPIEQSADVWASVLANVAPWMSLVGDRNAKEFLRVSSSRDQLLLMAAAPLGIFSILTSAIRLGGYPFLRRVVGR